ncbi:MAG: response regulator [Desulfovibrionaceae bacterium]|nr:response regulator [Desulfovibrionaceae bacterium]
MNSETEKNIDVLIIDDEPSIRTSIAAFLEDHDFRIATAENGEEGLKIFFQDKPKVVITDLRMPIVDGFGVLTQVVAYSPETPVIILTGQGTMSDAIEAIRLGAWDFLTKPLLDLSIVHHAVNKALEIFETRHENKLYSLHLEERVFRRTNELQKQGQQLTETNKRLREEIDQRKKEHEQLIQADKMITLGTLVSGVAHEINNPNNFIMLNMPVLEQVFKEALPLFEKRFSKEGDFLIGKMRYSILREKIPNLLSGVLDGSRRIKRIVDDLKNFARQDNSDFSSDIDMGKVVESSVLLINKFIKKSTSHFHVFAESSLPCIKGNAQRLEQVVINLLQNSCNALTDIENKLEVFINYDPERKEVVVEVRDEGIGMDEHTIKHIIDPFFTTRRTTGGTGLGLSVSARIVQEHGGSLNFESVQGKGTSAFLKLPVTFNT